MSETNGQTSEGKSDVSNFVPSFEITASGTGRNVKMSFDPKTPEGAIKLVQATLKEVPLLETINGQYIDLVDWMCHPAQKIDPKSQEVKEFSRIVVWNNKGEAYSCGSQGVDKSIAVLELTRGKAPWAPPMRVKVWSRRLGNGNNWLTLDPDIDSLTSILKPRKK